MDTYKKFIKYYGPYKTVFFFDLLCAAFISIVDSGIPADTPNPYKYTVFKGIFRDP